MRLFDFLKADIADPAACRSCVEQVINEFGRLDVLVHSAGGAVPGGLYEVTDESWMNAFAVHVHSDLSSLPGLRRRIWRNRGKARSSCWVQQRAFAAVSGALAYGVVKGALPQFARSLARELADQNIRVNCVSPGIIRTPFHAHLTPEQVDNNIR